MTSEFFARKRVLPKLISLAKSLEDRDLHDEALSLIPTDELRENARARADARGSNAVDKYFIAELAQWFKMDFFKWLVPPRCSNCQGHMIMIDHVKNPDLEELGIVDLEVYHCASCHNETDVARVDDVRLLIKTRKGRCAEWALVFGLMCRALDFRTRLVFDATDHMWNEVFIDDRWVHVDACEVVVDSPLLYERKWEKELSYVLAVGIDDVQDVTWRYVSDHAALRARRNLETDEALTAEIILARQEIHAELPQERRNALMRGVVAELSELLTEPGYGEDNFEVVVMDPYSVSITPYVHKPHPHTVADKKLVLRYSAINDKYSREGCTTSHVVMALAEWFNYCNDFNNICRKVEPDWSMAYLTRECFDRDGYISWMFDTGDANLTFKSITINGGGLVWEEGEILWEVKADDVLLAAVKMPENFEVDLLNSDKVEVTCTMSGLGASGCTQIFREGCISHSLIHARNGFEFILE